MRNPLRPPFARLAAMLAALCAVVFIAFAGATAIAQQDGAGPSDTSGLDTVIATVGEDTITEADLAFAAEDLQQELAQVPPGEQRAFLVAVLIDMKVMAQAARALDMDETELFRRRLQFLEERALRRAYFADQVASVVTPEAVAAAYEAVVAEFEPQEEVRARHVLVATREEAEAVKAQLEGGAPFETVAVENSIDPSAAQNGGDLGFFQRGRMVKPFEDVAFTMQPGEISDPVESQFGWHVIRLEERRESAPPPLAQLQGQLQQQLIFESYDEKMGALKDGVEITVADPALAASVLGGGSEAGAPTGGDAVPTEEDAAPTEEDAAPTEE